MKKNLKKASWLMAVIIAAFSIASGCKKNNELQSSSPAAENFLPASPSASKAINTVVSNLESEFLQNDYRADFINWHGQPLWDKAIELKKDAANAIVLIPTSKAGNIEAFIAARLKDGAVVYELHRRSAVEANVPEPSGMGINAVFTRGMLAYFNNSIYNKVDQVPAATYAALQKAAANNNNGNGTAAGRMVTVTICYNVGYCADCIGPEGVQVCCYTQKVCTTITYDDGTGGGIIIIGGGGIGGGGTGGDGGPGPVGCSPTQSSWYSENPAPAPCEVSNCEAKLYEFANAGKPVSGSVTEVTESETQSEMNKSYNWKIYSAVTWGLLSYEKAVLEKVYYPSSGQNLWEYKSFVHDKIVAVGFNIGGSRTFVDIGATINKTKAMANVRIDYTVTSKVSLIVCDLEVTIPYNANKQFRVPATALFGD
jgi:hypothetical protein